jgi:Fic family protein
MIKPPPDWKQILSDNEGFKKLLTSDQLANLIKKANDEYIHWDKFRYQPMPEGISPASAWSYLKLIRKGSQESLPIVNEYGLNLSVYLGKNQNKILNYIDTKSSGSITSSDTMPTEDQKSRLIINGLMEEAISSSQIEGANTTRKVAKNMLERKLPPKNKSEQMILNNYLAMTQLEDWKRRELSDDFILELHKVLTSKTLGNPNDEGRFRIDEDEIVVADIMTGRTIHTPPKMKEAKEQLKQLYKFINTDDDDNFVHPFVKASILHFCIGYIHPFVDGNGRLARAIFYWYLIKKDYWLFKFLPISLQIKKAEWRPGYYRAFEYVETDECDVTYFLNYKLRLAKSAIEEFTKYLEKKKRESLKLKNQLITNNEINDRQLDAIDFLKRNPNDQLDLQMFKQRHKIAYETARTDLLGLTENDVLKQIRSGKKYLFVRGGNFPIGT